MSLHVAIDTISHSQHRYETVGDYYKSPNGKFQIFEISDMSNKDYEFLVAIHELIEQYLTEKRGIGEQVIDTFDKEFEANRKIGNFDEPGDNETAPYHKEHQFATKIEKLIATELGVDWKLYNKTVCEL